MAGTRERKEQRLKLFVEHYLQHGDATASAKAAGYKGTERSMQVVGSRLLSEVERRGLITKARERVSLKVQRSTDDWAARLWRQADGVAAAETQVSWKNEKTGRFHVKRYKPQEALKALAPLYVPKEPAQPQTQVNVLNVIPPELSAQLYRALIGPNGNGSHA